jgi:hypothetical protein
MSCVGENKTVITRHKGKRPVARLRRRCGDNTKMDLKEIELQRRIGFIWLKKITNGATL